MYFWLTYVHILWLLKLHAWVQRMSFYGRTEFPSQKMVFHLKLSLIWVGTALKCFFGIRDREIPPWHEWLTKDSQHFIFTDDHTLSLNDFSLVHSHLLGTGSCSWYRLGIYALCIILNMRKRKRMALDAPQIKKNRTYSMFVYSCYVAI